MIAFILLKITMLFTYYFNFPNDIIRFSDLGILVSIIMFNICFIYVLRKRFSSTTNSFLMSALWTSLSSKMIPCRLFKEGVVFNTTNSYFVPTQFIRDIRVIVTIAMNISCFLNKFASIAGISFRRLLISTFWASRFSTQMVARTNQKITMFSACDLNF